jgi:hypothetical protein
LHYVTGAGAKADKNALGACSTAHVLCLEGAEQDSSLEPVICRVGGPLAAEVLGRRKQRMKGVLVVVTCLRYSYKATAGMRRSCSNTDPKMSRRNVETGFCLAKARLYGVHVWLVNLDVV